MFLRRVLAFEFFKIFVGSLIYLIHVICFLLLVLYFVYDVIIVNSIQESREKLLLEPLLKPYSGGGGMVSRD